MSGTPSPRGARGAAPARPHAALRGAWGLPTSRRKSAETVLGALRGQLDARGEFGRRDGPRDTCRPPPLACLAPPPAPASARTDSRRSSAAVRGPRSLGL